MLKRAFTKGSGKWFLPVVSGAYLLGLASYLFVFFIDPYALRGSQAHAKLLDYPYADRIVPNLFSIAAKDGSDVVVVGGSSSMGYTTAMLRRAFPSALKPVNLSFLGPSARDFDMELNELSKSKSLRRVILSLEWSFIKDDPIFGRIWNKRPYTATWHDPVPEYSLETVRLSAKEISSGTVDLPEWHGLSSNRPDFMIVGVPITDRSEDLKKLQRAVELTRSVVTKAPPIPCGSMPYLQTVLKPHLQALAQRGVAVDVLFPPYALSIYSDWSVNAPYSRYFGGDGAPFANLVSLRRCVVATMANLPNVRVHAFDTDLSITANLSNYADSAHVLSYEVYQSILGRVAENSSAMTQSQWPQFESDLKRAVDTFSIASH